MFGIYRFILTVMVLVAHLASPVVNWMGVYAVFCFYLLSGYLMTLILNERYGFDITGLRRYAVNRILRIYPPYLFIFIIAIMVAGLIPEIAQHINPALSMPLKPIEWTHNLFIFGLNGDTHRLIPPAWSVDVELFFYCSMGVFFARNSTICFIWFFVSLIATVLMLTMGADFSLRYGSIIGASLPFSVGSMMYYFKNELFISPQTHIPKATILFLLYACFSNFLWANPRNFGFYISLILGIYLQISLANLKRSDMPSWLRVTDSKLGDLAYPIFLCHWHVGAAIAFIAPFGVSNKGIILCAWTFFASIILSLGINQFIEQPIEKIRIKFKTSTGEQIVQTDPRAPSLRSGR
ncbi:MAG: acyltransferase [Proteobacteria bacterium]|nr:acyltransferase [Pseudomonadota bacterium]MBU1648092.1 acyltransferase [Pseudomonadota bacterium]